MDSTLMYLLGFLTENMWLQALSSSVGANSRERIKALAREVWKYYPSLGWSDKTMQKLGLLT